MKFGRKYVTMNMGHDKISLYSSNTKLKYCHYIQRLSNIVNGFNIMKL